MAAPNPPISDSFKVNDTEWTPVPDITSNLNGFEEKIAPKLHFNVVDNYLNFTSETRPAINYFKLMFPMQLVPSIIAHTNQKLRNRFGETCALMTNVEFLAYAGLRLAMALDPLYGSRKDYWATKQDEKSIQQPRCYGLRFKMSRDRFEAIDSCLSFSKDDDDNVRKALFCVLIRCFIICLDRKTHGLKFVR